MDYVVRLMDVAVSLLGSVSRLVDVVVRLMGVVVRFGRGLIKMSSNIQSTIALSSGESEYYALVKAAAIGLSLVALLKDWAVPVTLRISSDSSAAKGTSGSCDM